MVACDDGDGEYPADTFIVHKLFRRAPIATQSEELKQLVDQIADARAELYDVRTKINETKKKEKVLLEKAAAYPHLKRVLEYLEGDLLNKPCLLTDYSGMHLKTLKEALVYRDYGSEKYKLLTLFGNGENKSLEYKVSEYSDGSGSTYQIELFGTLEEAGNELTKRVREQIDDALQVNDVAAAASYVKQYPGRATPEHLARIDAYLTERMKNQIAKKASEIVDAQKELEALKSRLQQKGERQ